MKDTVERAAKHSPFLREAIRRNPELLARMTAGRSANLMLAADPGPDVPLHERLRRWRDGLALMVALGDLGGILSLEQVTTTLSDFADRALDLAIADTIVQLVPGSTPGGFGVVALGKHGSRELNYSSDIDPIFVFNPDTLPRRARDDPGEMAVRAGRGIIDRLQSRDGHGYVFRVDLRLRPSPEVTPIALPVSAAISHYESSAVAWERVAFVRARAAAGDRAVAETLLSAIQPFVWRRSLDFGAIGELRAISGRIRNHYVAGQRLGPGYDLKRGRGGIRELEFFVQINQLIHGGRDPSLRVGGTLDAIAALANAGIFDLETAARLSDAYRVLRTIEHRLQMVDDRQTHSLPQDAAALDNVAMLHGLANGPALIELLAPHVTAVGLLFDGLVDPAPRPVALKSTESQFADPARADRLIAGWRSGRPRAIRSPAAREAFEHVLPAFVDALGTAADPDRALVAADAFINGLSSGVNLFRLLEARPKLFGLLNDILVHAPPLADALALNPSLMDRLIDDSAMDPLPSVDTLSAQMKRSGGSLEVALDRVREITADYRFALGVQLISSAHTPPAIGRGHARLAEAAIETVAQEVGDAFAETHGRVPGSDLAIVALGRLGGRSLTHASDLDLIYLFSGDFSAESTGPRQVGATLYYNRLAQRITGGLSVPTSAGRLYEVDTRLRPSGAKGPLASSIEAFDEYQRKDAWTWEHMALARARPIFGPTSVRQDVAGLIRAVLLRPRDRQRTARDVLKMRAEVATHKPPRGPWDVKLGRGGLVDLEFIVHFHQLTEGIGLDPDLSIALASLTQERLVGAELAQAYDLLDSLIVTLRLVSPSMSEPVVASRAIVAHACGAKDWPELLAKLADARHCVAREWMVLERSAGA